METEVFNNYLKIIQNSLIDWKLLPKDSISFTLLTGTSNKVFKVTNHCQADPESVIFRVFGPNEVTDKSRERKIFEKLGQLGLGPKTFFVNSETRVEEYLENFLPLTYNDLSELSVIQLICDKLKAIHSINMEEILNDEPDILLENLEKWRKIGRLKLDFIENLEKKRKVEEFLSDSLWEKFLFIAPKDLERSFVHFDLNFFNILFNRNENKIALVDFEFSGFGHKAFDLAFLLSDMRFDYLVNEFPGFGFDPVKGPDDRLVAEYVRRYGEGIQFWVQVKKAFVCCNFVWAVWDLAMWKGGTQGFDYLENSLIRFDEFCKESGEFLDRPESELYLKGRILFDEGYSFK